MIGIVGLYVVLGDIVGLIPERIIIVVVFVRTYCTETLINIIQQLY